MGRLWGLVTHTHTIYFLAFTPGTGYLNLIVLPIHWLIATAGASIVSNARFLIFVNVAAT